MRFRYLLAFITVGAFATLIASTSRFSGTDTARAFDPPSSGVYVAVDCNRTLPGIQDDCFVGAGETQKDVDIVFGNVDVAGLSLAAIDFTLRAEQTAYNPRPGADANLNGNPDFNDATFAGNWNCSINPPAPDRNPDPAIAESRLQCFTGTAHVASPPGSVLVLGTVRYDILGDRTSDFDLMEVVIGSSSGAEVMSCNPVTETAGPCFSAHVGPPPTPTPTPTATATNTPVPTATSVTPGVFTPPASGAYVVVDCDRFTPGTQISCPIAPGETLQEVDVVLGNVDIAAVQVSAIDFVVVASQLSFIPRAGIDANLNGNPDFNQTTFAGNWNCTINPPAPDRNPDPAVAESRLQCFTGTSPVPFPPGARLVLGTVRYDAVGARTSDFSLMEVVVGSSTGAEIMSCNPVTEVAGACTSAHVEPQVVVPTNTPAGPTNTPQPPTNTPTNTPTATATPAPLLDTDADGMFDLYELLHPCLVVGTQDGHLDFDNDGATNVRESQANTDACAPDSDMDGMNDGYELTYACLQPLAPDAILDSDGDGLSNGAEQPIGTSPCNADTDADGYNDGREVTLNEDPVSFCPIMRADVNDNSTVNVIDLYLAAREFGPVPPGNPRMNQNDDVTIDVLDLFRIAQRNNKHISECP